MSMSIDILYKISYNMFTPPEIASPARRPLPSGSALLSRA